MKAILPAKRLFIWAANKYFNLEYRITRQRSETTEQQTVSEKTFMRFRAMATWELLPLSHLANTSHT